tara:strand:+ start:238 stop:786 length:549 start_codon:yes stop_codon:yes gene_type:complete
VLIKYTDYIFDYDNTICSIPIDWKTQRLYFKEFAKENFHFSFDNELTVEQMEKTLLMEFPLLKEQIYQFRSVLEPKYLNKHLLNKNIFSKLKSTNNNYIVSNNLTNTVISGLEYFNLLHFFKKVIGVDFMYSPKPSTKSWLFLKEYYNLSVSSTVMIGDNPMTDGLYASNIGLSYENVQLIT